MMLPMEWAHQSSALRWVAAPFVKSHFWFPRPVQPEVIVQAIIDVCCLLLTGFLTTRIYQASSRNQLLTPFVYPLLLVACGATYIMHTVQNFRFIYDLPSLALFCVAMYVIYFRKHWGYFAALFVVATANRETTLLLLPLLMLNGAVKDGVVCWQLLFRDKTMMQVLPLAAWWIVWRILIGHTFAHNMSEFYPRIDWNLKSLVVPQAWPQLLSACGYLLLFVVVMRRSIIDSRLRAWLWILPVWFVFMFVFGILIETRVFGELIPFVVCGASLITEQTLIKRMKVATDKQSTMIAGAVIVSKAA